MTHEMSSVQCAVCSVQCAVCSDVNLLMSDRQGIEIVIVQNAEAFG
jgi:hypothetical protein